MNYSQNPYQQLFIYYLEGRLIFTLPFEDQSFIGNWEEDQFTFLFFSDPADDKVENLIELYPEVKLLDRFSMSYDEWHGEALRPVTIGDFLIEPPWHASDDPKANPKHHHILLDPGVVFGTGTHPTTKDCLAALETVFADQIPERCIDIGTGTGILSIAAACLGCPATIAIDLNFLAVRTAMRNIRLNNMADRILAVQGSAEGFIDAPGDLMIANIHYDVMKRLLDSPDFYSPRTFILSGLLRSEAMIVKERLLKSNAVITQSWDQNGIWFTFLGKTG